MICIVLSVGLICSHNYSQSHWEQIETIRRRHPRNFDSFIIQLLHLITIPAAVPLAHEPPTPPRRSPIESPIRHPLNLSFATPARPGASAMLLATLQPGASHFLKCVAPSFPTQMPKKVQPTQESGMHPAGASHFLKCVAPFFPTQTPKKVQPTPESGLHPDRSNPESGMHLDRRNLGPRTRPLSTTSSLQLTCLLETAPS